MEWRVCIQGLEKSFYLYEQDARIPVLKGFCMELYPGECVALHGPSGAGKSTLLNLLYGNYKTGSGSILVRHNGRTVDIAAADPCTVMSVRKTTIGYVSQFLRVIPRVPALEVVMEPLLLRGAPEATAREKAAAMLLRLQISKRLWGLSPATFSGGEKQRINIARGFAARFPVMILDEPTASLDPDNQEIVREIIREALRDNVAVVGIFHNPAEREAVATRSITMKPTGDRP
ncbi:MAG: phosphonate C-P lyase system protein PhnL [Thermodesulfobacteriota bacterium]|nr:phosphonate C-P lyase system protein PhnL [Thermodesulfobacteriota bacterium]